jgi:hypothetical protein
LPRTLALDLTPNERALVVAEGVARFQLANEIYAKVSNADTAEETWPAILDAAFAGFGFAFEEAHQRGDVKQADAKSAARPTPTAEPPPEAWGVIVCAPIRIKKEAAQAGYRWTGSHYRQDCPTREGALQLARAARKQWPNDKIHLADPQGNPAPFMEA